MFKCNQLDSILISEISALSSFTVKYIEKKNFTRFFDQPEKIL